MNDIDCSDAIYTERKDWDGSGYLWHYKSQLANGKYIIRGFGGLTWLIYFLNGTEYRFDGPSSVWSGEKDWFSSIRYCHNPTEQFYCRNDGPSLIEFDDDDGALDETYYVSDQDDEQCYLGQSIGGYFIPAAEYIGCKTFEEALKIFKMNQVLDK